MKVVSATEQLLFTTVRLETETTAGHGLGTCFIFDWVIDDRHYLFLVTNKHVVSDAVRGTVRFLESDGDQPNFDRHIQVDIKNLGTAFHGHPDPNVDVAVFPMSGLFDQLARDVKEPFLRAVTRDSIPTPEDIDDLDAIEDVIFVGYPRGLFDTQNNTPIVRTGVTATPVALEYCGAPVFLIDGSVFPGSSGSPVFFVSRGARRTRTGGVVIGETKLYLLGILSGVFAQEDEGEIELREIPTSKVPVVHTSQMIDLGYVYKARVIQEAIEDSLRTDGVAS